MAVPEMLTFPGDPAVIATLQAAITAEAHLNLQYRLDWRCLKNRGLKKVACKIHVYGHDAHVWLRKVTDRCLFLGGDPGYDIPAVTQAATLTDTLKNELVLEMAIVRPYEAAVQVAMKAMDDTTRNLFEHLLKFHQGHVKWLMTQLNLITGLGESEYIAEKL